MSSRLAPVLTVTLAALVFTACSAAPGQSGSTAAPAPTPAPATPVPNPTSSPGSGNVVGDYPELSVEVTGDGTIEVGLVDPEARAWRVAVSGTGARAGDRLELIVEVGDVQPTVVMREIRAGELVDVMDFTGMIGNPTAAAGGCHGTLPVCIASDGIRFPADGDGTLRLRLDLPEAAELAITGATAGWPGEPFILGPWEQTLPFVWPQG